MFCAADSAAGSGVKPSVATKRCSRNIRSGSSEKATSGAIGVRKCTGGQIGQTSEGVDQFRLGETQCDGVDREIPPAQVRHDVAGELDLRFAAVVVIHLAAESGDLVGVALPDRRHRPEPLPHSVHGVGPSGQRPSSPGRGEHRWRNRGPGGDGRAARLAATHPPGRAGDRRRRNVVPTRRRAIPARPASGGAGGRSSGSVAWHPAAAPVPASATSGGNRRLCHRPEAAPARWRRGRASSRPTGGRSRHHPAEAAAHRRDPGRTAAAEPRSASRS